MAEAAELHEEALGAENQQTQNAFGLLAEWREEREVRDYRWQEADEEEDEAGNPMEDQGEASQGELSSEKEDDELPGAASDDDEIEEMRECLESVEAGYEYDDVIDDDHEDQVDEYLDSDQARSRGQDAAQDEAETDLLDLFDLYT